MIGIPASDKRWHIVIELSNGQISYNSVAMGDLARYIREERKRILKETGKTRRMMPLTPWIIDVILRDCRKNLLSLYKTNSPEIINITVTPSIKTKEEKHE